MSATNAPFGFRAAFHPSGLCRPKAYTIASGYAQNIFQGDPVKLVDAGGIQLGTSDGTRTGTTDGISLLGILAGVEYVDLTGRPTLSPGWLSGTTGTNIVAFVYDDPETVFQSMYQNPTPGTTIQADIGEGCDWRPTAPGGVPATGFSNTFLSAVVATQGQFQIMAPSLDPSDLLTDAFVMVNVRINEHQYKAPTPSV